MRAFPNLSEDEELHLSAFIRAFVRPHKRDVLPEHVLAELALGEAESREGIVFQLGHGS